MKLELKRIGNSTGLILPKDLLARLGLEQGDEVFVTENPTGFSVKPQEDVLEAGMNIAREAMKTYQNALKELAK